MTGIQAVMARGAKRTGELKALIAVVVAVVEVGGVDHGEQHAAQHEGEVHDLRPDVVVLCRHVADDELREHLEGLVGGVAHDAAHLGRAHLLLAAALHQEHEGVPLRVHIVLHGVVEGRQQQLREALALTDQLAYLLQRGRCIGRRRKGCDVPATELGWGGGGGFLVRASRAEAMARRTVGHVRHA